MHVFRNLNFLVLVLFVSCLDQKTVKLKSPQGTGDSEIKIEQNENSFSSAFLSGQENISATLPEGSNFQHSFEVIENPSLKMKWYFQGTGGAQQIFLREFDGAMLTLNNLSPEQSGTYTLAVATDGINFTDNRKIFLKIENKSVDDLVPEPSETRTFSFIEANEIKNFKINEGDDFSYIVPVNDSDEAEYFWYFEKDLERIRLAEQIRNKLFLPKVKSEQSGYYILSVAPTGDKQTTNRKIYLEIDKKLDPPQVIVPEKFSFLEENLLKRIEVKEGEDFSYRVPVNDAPEAKYYWYYQPDLSIPKIRLSGQDKNALFLPNVEASQTGYYILSVAPEGDKQTTNRKIFLDVVENEIIPGPQLPPVPVVNINSGNSIYISNKKGSDSKDCGKQTSPCQNLSYAVNLAKEGDQLLLARGEIWTGPKGASSVVITKNKILVGAYGSGQRPVIDGQNIYPAYDSYTPMIQVKGDNVTIKDLEIRNSGGHGLAASGANNVVFDSIRIYHAYRASIICQSDKNRTGYKDGYRSTGEKRTIGCTIKNSESTLSQWSWKGSNDSALKDGVGTDNWPGTFVAATGTQKFLFENNYSYDNIGESFACFADSSNGIIRNNIVRGKSRIGIYFDLCYDTLAEKNLLIGASNGGSDQKWTGRNIAAIAIDNERHNYELRGISTDKVTKNIKIRNNLSANWNSGMYIGASSSYANYTGVEIVNNTFLYFRDYGFKIVNTIAAKQNAFLFVNNIFDPYSWTGNPSTTIRWSGDYYINNNYWSAESVTVSGKLDVIGGVKYLIGKVDFVKSRPGDNLNGELFRPSKLSSTIDKGSSKEYIGGFTTDFFGMKSYKFDIGAIQE